MSVKTNRSSKSLDFECFQILKVFRFSMVGFSNLHCNSGTTYYSSKEYKKVGLEQEHGLAADAKTTWPYFFSPTSIGIIM